LKKYAFSLCWRGRLQSTFGSPNKNTKQMISAAFKNLSDEQLISFIRLGDRKAFGELYSRYYKKVYHKCLSIIKDQDEAFDLAQETLMKSFDKLSTFRGESSFSTWLFIITQRHCLAALRKEKKSVIIQEEPNSNASDTWASPILEDADQRIEQEKIMFGLLNSLPDSEIQLLTLKYRDGESIENLQNKLNLSSSAVKMRLKRSKEKLNTLYGLALTYGLEQVLTQL
jgi:RNA polymerase sigma factor (sigma-70 family)